MLLMASSAAAWADYYIGFSVGNTKVKADLTSLGGGNIDEDTSMSKLYGGYRFNRYLGVEASYYNLAEVSVGQVGSGANAVSGSVDMYAFSVAGVAFVKLGRETEAYVKLGGAAWNADLQRNTTSASDDGIDAYFGLGASYNFTKKLAGTLDWEMIDSPNPEFSTLSLGFKWTF
jgi:hypothetical protein